MSDDDGDTIFGCKYDLLEKNEGHSKSNRKGAKKYNPYHKLKLKDGTKKIIIRMYDSNKNVFYFNFEDFDLVMKSIDENGEVKFNTWCKFNNGYIFARFNEKMVAMHRLIMSHYYPDEIEEKGIMVDHRNIKPTDNRKENLRLVTHSENMYNKNKIKRMCTASPLPKEIEDVIFPKYIFYTKSNRKSCGYDYINGFIISYHPMQGTLPNGKSKKKAFTRMKLNILEKLKLAIDYYKELNSKMTKENEKFPGQMKEVYEGIKDLEVQYYKILKKETLKKLLLKKYFKKLHK